VQTPLDSYNLDAFPYRFDHRESRVWSEQTLLFRVVQAGLDRLGSTQFCGSCAVLRRAALEDIGGFATGTAAQPRRSR
jgi:cellulose synthase (UDP-forming)